MCSVYMSSEKSQTSCQKEERFTVQNKMSDAGPSDEHTRRGRLLIQHKPLYAIKNGLQYKTKNNWRKLPMKCDPMTYSPLYDLYKEGNCRPGRAEKGLSPCLPWWIVSRQGQSHRPWDPHHRLLESHWRNHRDHLPEPTAYQSHHQRDEP